MKFHGNDRRANEILLKTLDVCKPVVISTMITTVIITIVITIIVTIIIVRTPCSTKSASAENPDYVEVV